MISKLDYIQKHPEENKTNDKNTTVCKHVILSIMLPRYHNQTMINYTPQTGKNVILDENGWSSVLLVSEYIIDNRYKMAEAPCITYNVCKSLLCLDQQRGQRGWGQLHLRPSGTVTRYCRYCR